MLWLDGQQSKEVAWKVSGQTQKSHPVILQLVLAIEKERSGSVLYNIAKHIHASLI